MSPNGRIQKERRGPGAGGGDPHSAGELPVEKGVRRAEEPRCQLGAVIDAARDENKAVRVQLSWPIPDPPGPVSVRLKGPLGFDADSDSIIGTVGGHRSDDSLGRYPSFYTLRIGRDWTVNLELDLESQQPSFSPYKDAPALASGQVPCHGNTLEGKLTTDSPFPFITVTITFDLMQ